MKFNLKRAVETLAKKDLKFLQPMYEAITNSLESNSTSIVVDIASETLVSDTLRPKVIGFTISDNGDGFTKANIDSFLELWSDAKIQLGCKGSGRFTWLNVFNDIEIKSEVASEGKLVTIPFSLSFDDDKVNRVDAKYQSNRTIIKFSNVTNKYYNKDSKIDMRVFADIDTITQDIEKNLLIKFFLLKKAGKKFLIKIKVDGQEREIKETTIPDLSFKQFEIPSAINKLSYKFILYYHFIDNKENSKKIYYCAHSRTVKEEDDDSLNFSCALPNKISFNMLLCSKYLDDMVNDSRDDFPGMSNKRQANWGCPLLYKDIKPYLLEQMQLILIEQFPELEKLNKEQEEKAISSSPYLTKYIKEISDVVKTEKSLTVKAMDAFAEHKKTIKKRFEKLLQDKSIDAKEFEDTVQELSEVATAELGEYILYRESIIKALEDATSDRSKSENFVHNIFMPQRKSTHSSDTSGDYTLTNLWLLDDKFMTFSNAFSDVEIRKIIQEIFNITVVPDDEIGMNGKRPDLAVFYNREMSRDALVFEFKNPNASLGEKEKAIAEISRNCLLLKEKIKDIDTIWAYIITSIDHEFEVSLRANGYKRKFTNASNGKILYFYNDEIGHLYALDINAITADAFARNKTFLSILKKQ